MRGKLFIWAGVAGVGVVGSRCRGRRLWGRRVGRVVGRVGAGGDGVAARVAREVGRVLAAPGSRRRAGSPRSPCSPARSAPRGRRRSRAGTSASRGCRPRPRSRRVGYSRRTRRRTAPRWSRSCPTRGSRSRGRPRCRTRASLHHVGDRVGDAVGDHTRSLLVLGARRPRRRGTRPCGSRSACGGRRRWRCVA